MHRRAAFPEAGIVVIFRDLLEAELLVVIGADPFGRVDRALLERRIDVAAGKLLRHHADLLQHLTGDAADAELQPGEIGDRLDLLAEPAAHLGAGVAAGETDHAVFLEELVAELHAAALIPPGVLHARIEAERHRRIDRKGRILADVIIRDGVAHLDGAVGGRIKRLQARNDFAGGKYLNLEFVVGHFRDVFRELGRAVVNGVERLREARRHAPFDLGRGLRDRRRGHRRGGGTGCGNFQKITTLHSGISLVGRFPGISGVFLSATRSCQRPRVLRRGFNTEVGLRKRNKGMTAGIKRKSHSPQDSTLPDAPRAKEAPRRGHNGPSLAHAFSSRGRDAPELCKKSFARWRAWRAP